ncbi:reverse transcriptase domain-containing protein [Tanacetum coccineum]
MKYLTCSHQKQSMKYKALTKKLAALSQFLSKEADKALLFLKILKNYTNKKVGQWTARAGEAFQKTKEYLETLPTLTALIKGEALTLQGAELNYPELEKLVLALVYAARRLQRYFQAHSIQILTDKPIKQILARPEKSGRIAKWAIELGERDIKFRERNSIKGKILEDFLAETPSAESKERNWSDASKSLRKRVSYAFRFEFDTTNNEAEYEALLVDLRIAAGMKVQDLNIFVDSQLVANQVKGLFEARHSVIKKYLEKTREILKSFSSCSMEHVRLDQNKKIDALSKLASMTFSRLAKEVLVEVLHEKSIAQKEVADIIKEEGENWRLPIREYLLFGTLPKDLQKAIKLRIKAPQYRMIDGSLYRMPYLSPWLRCMGPVQAKSIIQEIHQGSCRMHARSQSVVSKIMKLGYYWPLMHNDAKALIQRLGNYNRGTTADGPRRSKVPCRSLRLLHKVGLSETPGIYNGEAYGEICMGTYRVEVTNSDILKGMEQRLGETHQGWMDELPQVLWAHRKTP